MVVMDVDRMPGIPAAGWNKGSVVPWAGAADQRPTPVSRCGSPISRWQPLAGPELLERLRVTGRRRQTVDPELVARLDNGLEDGLGEGQLGEDRTDRRLAVPVAVTKDRLTGALACANHQPATPSGGPAPTIALACGALIAVLFRQLVAVGHIGDPMADGLAALSVDDHNRPLATWIGELPPGQRAELRAELARQADGMQQRWPALEPGWLPRTQESIRVPLLGGAIALCARVDLMIGRPAVNEASVAIVAVKSGAPRVEHRADLHYYALVETLRSAAPPFVVATYYTRTGELDVEPVTASLLFAAVHRTVAGARLLRNQSWGIEVPRGSTARCAGCAGLAGDEDSSGPASPQTAVPSARAIGSSGFPVPPAPPSMGKVGDASDTESLASGGPPDGAHPVTDRTAA